MTLPESHPQISYGKTGLLLVNLGTPETADAKGLRPYLKQFLSDRRVIETSPLIWQPILRGIILNLRPRKSARAYAKIWDRETNESPLRRYTREQAEGVARTLQADYPDLHVTWAMRYGAPSIDSRLAEMKQAGCDQIVVIALYPQYSASTTATVYDEVFRSLLKMRWQPAIRTAGPWHDDPAYITAMADSVTAHINALDWQPEVIIASFHGLPVAYFKKGDPYHCHCAKTARLMREKLGRNEDSFRLTFQSRFGPAKWLEPYTDKTLEQLAHDGVRKVAVVTPGFIADCVETLEEINLEAKHLFEAAGGTDFTTVACMNNSPAGIEFLSDLSRKHLSGWV